MTVETIGSAIRTSLTSGLSMIGDLATGLKNAILRIFTDGIVTDGVYTATNISVVGTILLVFAGVTVAFGMSKLAFHMFRSKIG